MVPAWIADPAGNREQSDVCGPVGQPAGMSDPDDNLAGARKLGTAADSGNMFAFPMTVRTKHSPGWASTGYSLPDLGEECEFSRTPQNQQWIPVFCDRTTRTGGDDDPSDAQTFADLDVFTQTGETATDRSTGNTCAAVIAAGSDSGCVAHFHREIARLKTLFANGASGIGEERLAVSQTRLAVPPAMSSSDTPRAL